MKYKGSKTLAVLMFSLILSSTANAALMGRLALTPGGTDYQAFYDDVLDITWLANANLALTETFGVSGVGATGIMKWDAATEWITAMNNADYLGFNQWRMPTLSPVNGSSFQTTFSNNGSYDKGYGATGIGWQDGSNNPVSEMGHLYYATLGNLGSCTPDNGDPSDCSPQGGAGLINFGADGVSFNNLESNEYWTGLEYANPNPISVWNMSFRTGFQNLNSKGADFLVLPVLEGDVAAVPVPAAVWLMGSALVGLFGFGRRKKS